MSLTSTPPALVSQAFVGRRRELAGLRAALEAAAAGRGRLVLLVGEPGVGKTRTAEELATIARDAGAAVTWGRCWEAAGAPAFWPWTQVLRACAADDPSLGARLAGTPAADLVAEPGRAPATPDGDDDARRFRLFDAVAGVVRAASERQPPLLIVLDDLHWADAPSVRLLSFVARSLPECRTLVVATYRELEVGADHPHADALGRLARHGDRLALGGLARDEVAALVRMVTGEEPARDLVTTLHERTEGNPFFVRSLVELLQTDGHLDPAALPPGVVHAVRERLATLPPACRDALATAAVAGRELAPDVLNDAEADALVPAVAAGLLRPADAGSARWRFVHALVRETAYDALSPPERARRHRAIAERIEARRGAALDAHVAELAHHHAQAASLAGPDRAVHWAVRAAERSRDVYAYEDAAAHYARALALLDAMPSPDGERRRLALLLALGDVELPAGRRPAARAHHLAAAELARTLGDPEALAHAALGYAGRGDLTTGPDPTVTGLLEEALAVLGPRHDRLRARVMSRLADALLFVPEARARRDALTREAVALAERLGDVRTLGVALLARRLAIWDPGHLDERLRVTARMIELGAGGRDAELELGGRVWHVVDLLEAGDLAAVDQHIAAYARLAEALRQPLYLWQVPSFRAMRATLAGRFADAERCIDEARREGERAGSPNVAFRSAVLLFALRRAEHRLAEIEPLLRAAVERFPAVAALRASLALACLESGRDVEARAQLEQLAADDFARVPRDGAWLATTCHLAVVAARLGDRPRAAALYDRLLPYADRVAVVSLAHGCEGAVSRFLGVLATALGRFADAERHFDDAHARNAALGAPVLVDGTEADRTAMRRARDAAARQPGEPSESVFRREGEVWTLAYRGSRVRLRHTKGLTYIAHLLGRPGCEVHVADLAGVDDRAFLAAAARDADRPDARARAAYRDRLAALREEVDAAERANDVGRASGLRTEMERLAAELGREYGLDGRRRAADDPVEKIRKAVTNRIRDALARIRTADPALGSHLGRAIRTGIFCSYRPEDAVRWGL